MGMRSAVQLPPYQESQPECVSCGALLPSNATYCMRCGSPLESTVPARSSAQTRPSLVSLTTGTIIALLLGVACLVATLVTGAIFNQDNLWDWQAVQAWRIEWLLGGIAFFVLACFLALIRRS